MVKAGPGAGQEAASAIDNAQAVRRFYAADPRDCDIAGMGGSLNCVGLGRCRGENEFVVISTGEYTLQRLLSCELLIKSAASPHKICASS